MTGEVKVEQKLNLTLSNSSISTFRQCPRSFYYNYVLRLPRKQKDYFILGTFVHRVLELFYSSLMTDRAQKRSELLGKCFALTRTEHPEANAFILADAKTILQDYLARIIARHKLPEKMVTENKFNIELEGIKLTGVIDRIDFGDDGHIDIIDYKTGKKAKKEKEFEDDLQLPLYTIAVLQTYDVPIEKVTCKLDHLKVRTEQKLVPTLETIEKATNVIVKCYKEIEERYGRMENESQKWSVLGPPTVAKIKEHPEWSKEFEDKFLIFINRYTKYWEPKFGWHCNYCDYYKICQNILF